ncbi:hypothetical protein ACGFRG_08100 [Streptomyces sp. NPDC048696]|uniref:hypothetical protein n=1 Tax=Streptomyces sp. NPDC048696 TaxID=3365585 RepID=UPI003723F628
MNTPPRPHAAPTVVDLRREVDLALTLSAHCPTSVQAVAVRGRLRNYIVGLEDQADQHAQHLEEGRAKDVAVATVRHAKDLARSTSTGGDPAATLRLLAKSVEILTRYATAGGRSEP